LERIAPAIMDISARASSLADRLDRAKRVTSVRMRGKTDPPSCLILSQTSAGKGYIIASSLALSSSFVRAWRRSFVL